jgi:hypothetical protein
MRSSRINLKLLSLAVAAVLAAALVLVSAVSNDQKKDVRPSTTASALSEDPASKLSADVRALAGQPRIQGAGPCDFDARSDNGISRNDAAGDVGQPGAPSVSVECLNGDVVISVSAEGADPAAVDQAIKESGANDRQLSSVIRTSFQAHALNVPNPIDLSYDDFDGTVEHKDGKVVFTIPEGEVRADWGGWKKVIAYVIGIGVGWTTYGICWGMLGSTPPVAAAVCSTVGGFIGGFTASLIESALEGRDLSEYQPWLDALALGVIGAVGASLWETRVQAWMRESAEPLLNWVSKAIKDTGNAIASWAGDSWRVAADAAAQAVQYAAEHFYDALVEAARKAGYPVIAAEPGVAVDNGAINETSCGAPDLLQINTSGYGSLCFANAGITDSYQIPNVTNVSSGNNNVILRGSGVDYDLPRWSTVNLQNVTIDYIQIL